LLSYKKIWNRGIKCTKATGNEVVALAAGAAANISVEI